MGGPVEAGRLRLQPAGAAAPRGSRRWHRRAPTPGVEGQRERRHVPRQAPETHGREVGRRRLRREAGRGWGHSPQGFLGEAAEWVTLTLATLASARRPTGCWRLAATLPFSTPGLLGLLGIIC